MMFTVLYKRNPGAQARLGLAISGKQCRGAVARNRLKRVIRESFRLHREALAGLDLVVINHAPAARASNKALFDSLDGHWQTCRSRVQGSEK